MPKACSDLYFYVAIQLSYKFSVDGFKNHLEDF